MNWRGILARARADAAKIGAVLRHLVSEIFPYSPRGSAEAFAEAQAKNPEAQQIVKDCEDAIAAARDPIAELLVVHARERLARENERQSSVIGRAQALFFAVALLGSLWTLGASFLTAATSSSRLEIRVIAAISAIILLQIYFLMRNVLKAIGGLNYLRPGSSEVTKWAKMQCASDVYRDEAVATLRWYRDASRKNTWRFTAFGRALKALRNILLCVFTLILVFFSFGVSLHPTCSDRVEFTLAGKPVYTVQTPCAAN
jgi:hypothetical protein